MRKKEKLIKILRQFQSHKGMYVQPITIQTTQAFLVGFLCGADYPRKKMTSLERFNARHEVEKKRGWKHSACGPVPHMKKKGLTEAEIVDELIEIEVDLLESWDA